MGFNNSKFKVVFYCIFFLLLIIVVKLPIIGKKSNRVRSDLELIRIPGHFLNF